jgi:hypothetical protein
LLLSLASSSHITTSQHVVGTCVGRCWCQQAFFKCNTNTVYPTASGGRHVPISKTCPLTVWRSPSR